MASAHLRIQELMQELASEHELMQQENQRLRDLLAEVAAPSPEAQQLTSPPPQAQWRTGRTSSKSSWQSGAPQQPPRSHLCQVGFVIPREPKSGPAGPPAPPPQDGATSKTKPAFVSEPCSGVSAPFHRAPTRASFESGRYSEPGITNIPTLKAYPDKSLKVQRSTSITGDSPTPASQKSLRETLGETNWRQLVSNTISTRKFDAIMGIVIIVNSLLIGVESSCRLEGWTALEDIFATSENIFLTIYIAEIAARIFAHGRNCFRNGWVRFDAALVLLGILGSWVIPPVMLLVGGSSGLDSALTPVLVLRVFRLFRLARAMRLVVQFRSLWMLVQGLIHSSITIASTLALIVVILYIFSCISVEVMAIPYSKEDSEYGDLIRRRFSDIPSSMLTMIRFVILDSVADMYEQMITEHSYLMFFFLPFMMIVSIALMNLVTAVIVEGALEQAKRDKAQSSHYKKGQLQTFLPHLQRIFQDLDANNDGALSKKEAMNAPDEVMEVLEDCLGVHNLEEMFEIIDEDKSGEVSVMEFCDGITRLACSDAPIELFMILTQLTRLRSWLESKLGSDSNEDGERPDVDIFAELQLRKSMRPEPC